MALPLNLHHLGWVVRSIDASLHTFTESLELTNLGIEDYGSLRICFLGAGCSMIELLEPRDTHVEFTRYLAEHGEGIHHIAFGVADIAAAINDARSRGVTLIDEQPRPGARNSLIAFVDPKRPDGVLIEFVQDHPQMSRLSHPDSPTD